MQDYPFDGLKYALAHADVLTPRQVAEILGMTVSNVHVLVNAGKLDAVRMPASILIDKKAVEDWGKDA